MIFFKLFRKQKNKFKKWYQDNYDNDDDALQYTYKFQSIFYSYFKKHHDIVAWDIAENKIGRNILRSALVFLKIRKHTNSSIFNLSIIPVVLFSLIVSVIIIILYELFSIRPTPNYFNRSKKNFPKVDILFFASYQNYLNPMIPVINECANRGLKISIILSDESDGWSRISELNLSIIRYKIGEILNKKYQRTNFTKKVLIFFEIIRFGLSHKNFSNLAIWATYIFSAYRTLVSLMPTFTQDFFDYNEFLQKIRPKILLFSRLSSTNEMTILKASKKNHINSFMLPHSYLSPGSEKYFLAGHLKFNSIFSIGKNFLKNFNDNPVVNKKCNIYDIGSVELEHLFFSKKSEKYFMETRSSIGKLLNIDSSKRWILYTSASYDQLNFEAIKNNIDLILPKNTILLVKFHPQANEDDFKVSAKINNQIKVLPKNIGVDIKDLILSSEVLITYRSFTNFEAMCLDKPVITIKLNRNIAEGRAIFKLEKHGFLFSDNIEHLSKNLNKLFKNKVHKSAIIRKQKKFIKEIFFNDKVKPTNKVVEILQKILNET